MGFCLFVSIFFVLFGGELLDLVRLWCCREEDDDKKLNRMIMEKERVLAVRDSYADK